MKPILEIKEVSKKYKIRSQTKPYLSLRESISSLLKPGNKNEEFWALKEVTFDVLPGDTIGIIGKNGAGKSTLLKILSKITPPTRGSITSRGRIASLLEVGTGFHPELSGRENIFLNGSILGMKKEEIRKQFDAIIDFSGVEKFIDTPLKHYSSGMQLRLAFAVAAYLEPEILIIDEVLAVGDTEFQKKCMGKMKDVSETGRTIIFVSHDLTAISSLTKKTLFLRQGQTVMFESTSKAIENYLADNSAKELSFSKVLVPLRTSPQITQVALKTSLPNNVHEHGKTLSIVVDCYTNRVPQHPCWVSVHITNAREAGIIHVTHGGADFGICSKTGETRFSCNFPSLKLYMGKYFVSVYMAGPPGTEVYERLVNVVPFEVVMSGKTPEYGWMPDTCTHLEENEWKIE